MRGSLAPIHLLAIKNVNLDIKCTPITYQEPGVFLARPAALLEKKRIPTVFPVGRILVGERLAKVPTLWCRATVIDGRCRAVSAVFYCYRIHGIVEQFESLGNQRSLHYTSTYRRRRIAA